MKRRKSLSFFMFFYSLSLLSTIAIHFVVAVFEERHQQRIVTQQLFEDMVTEKIYTTPDQQLELDDFIDHHSALARRNFQIMFTDNQGKSQILEHKLDDSPEINFSLPTKDQLNQIAGRYAFKVDSKQLKGWIKLDTGDEVFITLLHLPSAHEKQSNRLWIPLVITLLFIAIAFFNYLNRMKLWHSAIDYANRLSSPSVYTHKYNTYEPLNFDKSSVGQEFSRLAHALSRANYRLHHRQRKIDNMITKLERLVTHAPLPIVFIQNSGKISYINEQFSYVFVASLRDDIDLYITDFVIGTDKHSQNIINNLSKQKITQSILVTDKQNLQKFQLHIMPWFAKHGHVQGFTIMLNNVSQMNQQLESTLQQLEQQSAQLSDFERLWSVMGHELRTPLSGIIGMLDTINAETLSKEQQETFETLEQTSQTMLFMLNDMLDLAKLDAGKLQLSLDKTDILQMCRQVCDLMVGNARNQGIDLLFCFDPYSCRYINTDEARLRQVLLNLLGNAIKFTQSGFIALKVSVKPNADLSNANVSNIKTIPIAEDKNQNHHQLKQTSNTQTNTETDIETAIETNTEIDTDDGYELEDLPIEKQASEACTVCFEVIDTGIGISEEEQKRLFSYFNQANNTISKNFGGTGLGLAISKNFVEMLGGEISLSSTPKVGSKFEVNIPIDVRYDQPVYQFSGDFSNICIVALTYLDVKSDYLKTLCHYLNINAVVGVGLENDEINHINQQLNSPELTKLTKVFVIDHFLLQQYEGQPTLTHMPKVLTELTGFSQTAKILLSMTPERSIPSNLMECFDGYLSSPMDVSYLISEVVRLAQQNQEDNSLKISKLQHTFNTFMESLDDEDENAYSQQMPEDTVVKPKIRPLILIAEDDRVNQQVAVKLLKKLGYRTMTANNGEEVLDIIALHRQEIRMILMDCHMPVMDGFEATQHIRNNEDSIPIIALTANDTDKDRSACLRAGMDNFMPKPLKKEVLEAMLKKYRIDF